MPPKPGLGRGLDALIFAGKGSKEAGILTLKIDQISPNPHQPRSVMKPEDLQELAEFDPYPWRPPASDCHRKRRTRPLCPHRRRTTAVSGPPGWFGARAGPRARSD